jgi:hypothetical protein
MADPARLRGSLSQRSRLRGKFSHYAGVDDQNQAPLNAMQKPNGIALRQPIPEGRLNGNDLACQSQPFGFEHEVHL